MRAALVTFEIGTDLARNLAEMERTALEAASRGAQLVLFPEAAPTGLINNDNPDHDLRLGSPVPGSVTDRWARIALETRMYFASGLLEREGGALYDSAVLLGPDGRLLLHYRRIQPQWHGREACPEIYRQGSAVPVAETAFGRFVILLCGDLFDDGVCEMARCREPDILLLPFARCFSDGSFDQTRWDREEAGMYATRVAAVGVTTLIVNALESHALSEHPCFGGASVITPDGVVMARHGLGRPGTLIVDLPTGIR